MTFVILLPNFTTYTFTSCYNRSLENYISHMALFFAFLPNFTTSLSDDLFCHILLFFWMSRWLSRQPNCPFNPISRDSKMSLYSGKEGNSSCVKRVLCWALFLPVRSPFRAFAVGLEDQSLFLIFLWTKDFVNPSFAIVQNFSLVYKARYLPL